MPDNYKLGEFTDTNPPAYKQTIVDALNNGAIGWLGSVGQTTDAGNGQRNLVSGDAVVTLGAVVGWISADRAEATGAWAAWAAWVAGCAAQEGRSSCSEEKEAKRLCPLVPTSDLNG